MSKAKKLTKDDLTDLAIQITNRLIELNYVPDCTDTDDESEFEVQDEVKAILKGWKLKGIYNKPLTTP